MSEFKGTPGPWRVDETKALGAYGVWTDYAVNPGHDGAGYPQQICSVTTGKVKEWTGRREQRDADARLIAAAPDMIAALASVAVLLEGLAGSDELCDFYAYRVAEEAAKVQAAVAKATG